MIAILNFGGQTCHLIARRVRELGVYSEIFSHDIPAKALRKSGPEGIILSGGPNSVYEKDSPHLDKEVLELGIPVMGICYGFQLLSYYAKGEVQGGTQKEYGRKMLSVERQGTLLKGLLGKEQVWMSHGDLVKALPREFTILARTEHCPVAAFENRKRKLYGVLFHPEVAHTLKGMTVLGNFVFGACRAKKDWDVSSFVPRLVKDIRKEVGGSGVIMGVSGGVDSSVAATLLHKAVGRSLHCVFIDHGLIRKGEAKEVARYFRDHLHFEHFHMVDASKLFLSRLKGVTDPEEKRKIIGHAFIEAFEKKVAELERKHPNITFLGQGTIYPDRIESAQPSKAASKIKSHHNVTLPEKMKLKVIEPLKELYKDEVRELGLKLGIPQELIGRHPFPGPGLAIRILGEVTEERLRIVREADFIFIGELKNGGHYDKVWQAFAALFPVRSVGVMGDARTYEYIISLRAVTSKDAMTADWAQLPHEFLSHVASRIVNEVRGVNRVVYDITQKPPGTIEYE